MIYKVVDVIQSILLLNESLEALDGHLFLVLDTSIVPTHNPECENQCTTFILAQTPNLQTFESAFNSIGV